MRKCAKFPHNVETSQRQLGLKLIPGGQKVEEKLIPWKVDEEQLDQELCRKALARMIIVDAQPFSFVEREGFKSFIKVVQPKFQIPSRSTVIRDCFELYGEEKQKLRNFFQKEQRLCLTIDTWTSLQKIKYMCVTAHFIDKDWTLHKKVLNFCPISSHKSDNMATAILNCLFDWGLDKVFTVTIDNASSNDVMVKELSKRLSKLRTNMMDGNHLHMRSMAHIINLIVQDGLKEVGDSVTRVRQAVRYIRQSPERWRMFKEGCKMSKIKCEESLCLDVPTRWNSIYLMLNVAQELENAFVSYGSRDPGLLHYLVTYVCEDGKPAGSLESNDWKNVRHLVKFLKIFCELTLKVLGSIYVTSNVHFLEICEIDYDLKRLIENDDVELSLMAKKIKDKFDKHWGNPEKYNKMFFIASVLDPRCKFEFVAFALVSMFGEEKGRKIKDEVMKYMTSLFDEYLKRNSERSRLLPSSSGQTLDINNETHCKTSLSEMRQKFMRYLAHIKSLDTSTELEKYLSESAVDGSDNFDILLWWETNSGKFPILAEMARDVLAIPISSVASESEFDTGGHILDSFRISLTPKMLQVLVCVQDWLRSESLPVRVEENFDYLEQLELDFANKRIDS